MAQKVNLYEDCLGNIEIDQYYRKSDLEKLKVFLKDLGYEVSEVIKHKKSFEKGKPFRDKPCVAKRIVKEVDWLNPKVIFEILDSPKTEDLILKDIVKESGKVDPEKSKATEMTIIMKFRDISREYEKWKVENHITETNENKKELHKQFSDVYVALLKKKRQKRLEIGARVYIQQEDIWGEIKDYDKEKGLYCVKDVEGGSGWYKRKEIFLKEER
jgi:hypothetical protein